ncbi:diguanylate cyclase [Rhizobium sp. L245/93]|uniref:sensor domain-containing diguanylate cyclase n=1 Tax=Rhizobium sp. L245/93 TaxID=2819998 RepID=UPI001AD995EC|nr:diguanylate cyclase [Rhizobium sp. L245/93]MBO9171738.1 diguanylate cyclase [Rhizobium sp. L245/93]
MRFVRFKLVGPTILGMAVLIAGMAAISYFGVGRLDAETRRRQEMLVERNVSIWISEVEFSLTAWTVWDEAIANLDNVFDRSWTDRNIGASLIGTSRTRAVIVLDATDKIIYSKTDETVQGLSYFVRGPSAIAKDAAELVKGVRIREQQHKQPGIPQPTAVSRIMVIGDESVLLSASLFQPDFGTSKPKGPRGPILITAMPIAGTLQGVFGERFDLDDARIEPLGEVSPDRARAAIAVGPQGEVEVISWRSPTPATDILWQSSPLIVTVGLVLIIGSYLMIKTSHSAAQSLLGRERQMRHAATHDFLTGLPNRFLLDLEFVACTSAGVTQVICLDLDGFKGVNDRHGHATGDELLQVVAERLRSGTRGLDRIFRLGGDEFAIFMPCISTEEAREACQRLSALLAAKFKLSICEVSIGASFGISQADERTPNCDAALKAADAALYHAKSVKRGSVVVNGDLSRT